MAPKMVGLSRIMPFFMAFAYQSMPRLGMLPFRMSPIFHPGGLMAKCGSGMCGHEKLKLKKPFIFSMRPQILSFASVIGPTMASLMALNFSLMAAQSSLALALIVSQFL